MKFSFSKAALGKTIGVCCGLLVIVAAIAAYRSTPVETRQQILSRLGLGAARRSDGASDAHGHDGHDGHEAHAAPAAGELDSLELSAQARRNIGLTSEKLRPVRLSNYVRSVSIPAMIVELPGRTRISVVAPTSGFVTAIAATAGETVESGKLLFSLRLTHQDLVDSQAEFLRLLGKLDVERREIARLESIRDVVAGKVLLERKYEEMKLEAELNASREALLLHGLSERQIETIESSRRLLREMQVQVPRLHQDSSLHDSAETVREERSISPIKQVAGYEPPDAGRSEPGHSEPGHSNGDHADDHTTAAEFVMTGLMVHKGQSVVAGEALCTLSDFHELYIEGRAFEQDAEDLVAALRAGQSVTAIFEGNQGAPERIEGLKIAYLSNRIETDSRAFHFYVTLPNRIVHESETPQGLKFRTWKYKPGQRLQLLVPIAEWQNQIVLPVEAVAHEGAESFVFQQNGNRFVRRPVHVQYRDQFELVIANDGSLYPGDTIAYTGAHQLQMALKNKAGGGVDPHAGHSH